MKEERRRQEAKIGMKERVCAMKEKELMSFIWCEWTIIRYDGNYNLVVKKIRNYICWNKMCLTMNLNEF
jgi:hypothetical protein